MSQIYYSIYPHKFLISEKQYIKWKFLFLGALATECEQKELWQYAGLCWLAAARCQGTLENASSEINLLIKAGRQFLIADKKDNDIGCPSIGHENIQVFV